MRFARPTLLSLWTALLCAAVAVPSVAADTELQLIIKNHRFEPAELKVPAGQRIKLLVHNQDATPEEFESHALNREKVIPGNSQTIIFVGPLYPGTYPFFGEFNQQTAQGKIIAK